ncbi:MAG TPA: hypothetical protein VK867_02430, partial [Candidatus Limnocylindrales bacterium]|nr:hypothetical protein [Candidatus Limnocylindrales bacterium]
VGGDARIAGGTVSVGGAVTEDLAAAGGQVSVDPSATIGEDMLASAGRLAMDGSVTGDLTATTGTYEKTGTVGGAEDVRLTPTRADTTPAPAQTVAGTVLDAIQHFLVVVFVGAILVWLAPRAYASVTETIQRRPLPAAGWGVIGLIGYIVALLVIAVAMIVLAIIFGIVRFDDLVGLDVLGGIVAMLGLTLGFVVVCAYVADAVVGAAAAGLLMRSGSPTRTRELGLLAIGAAGVVVLSVLPVVGPLIKLVVVVLGLGAILMLMWNARQTPTVEHPIAIPPTG